MIIKDAPVLADGLTTMQAAARAKMDVSRLRRAIYAGQLPATLAFGQWLIRPHDPDAYVGRVRA